MNLSLTHTHLHTNARRSCTSLGTGLYSEKIIMQGETLWTPASISALTGVCARVCLKLNVWTPVLMTALTGATAAMNATLQQTNGKRHHTTPHLTPPHHTTRPTTPHHTPHSFVFAWGWDELLRFHVPKARLGKLLHRHWQCKPCVCRELCMGVCVDLHSPLHPSTHARACAQTYTNKHTNKHARTHTHSLPLSLFLTHTHTSAAKSRR